ncbi:hypothetical protein DVX31_13065, partial [Enterococcus faecium]
IIGNPSLNHRYRKGFYSLFKTLQQNRFFLVNYIVIFFYLVYCFSIFTYFNSVLVDFLLFLFE